MTKGTHRTPIEGSKPKPPFLYEVLLKMEDGDKWGSVFDRDLFEHITKGKGKEAEFYYKAPSNPQYGPTIIGILRIGNTEYVDGKLPVIQMKDDRGKSLYD